MHEYERPIAMLALQQAEINKDPKKNKKSFRLQDFCFYNDEEGKELMNPKYGSAAIALLKNNLLPVWALFIYKDLANSAGNMPPPNELALLGDDCILLAPTYQENECHGMLIAMESASNTVRDLRSTSGHIVTVRIPAINSKIAAIEDTSIRILN